MTLKKMKYFIDVMQQESITKAAIKNNITQCAMSQQIKAIEKELGVLLLIRGRNQLIPTKEGILFYTLCKDCTETHNNYMIKIKNT
ncbi:LysR family transcriptional regulator [Faecalicatena sp. Marseille-Q4148]|nr:LysR family transcriptional regulator [Faecalicatena sp. Marseille-Q4148]